ncbi:hypothetical protein [Flavitalea sp.]|nr:hypothetical protein [Flavitalea sp.]
MEDNIFDIRFDYNGLHYQGWANPSPKKNGDGSPASYHVVLNDISFGNVSFNQGKWINSEDRPDELIALVGKHIEKNQK